MKPRHAAALALVGWYLMMPLIQGEKETVVDSKADPHLHYIFLDARIDLKAPLSKWTGIYAGESERDCNVFRARHSKGSGPSGTEEERRRYAQMDKILRDHATCIASDDPRLKGNRHLLREPTD